MLKTSFENIITFLILLATIFTHSACRFKTPGSSETAALESRGAFSGGAPAWAKLPKEKSTVLPGRAGIMNRTHTIPQGMSMSSAANASSSTSPSVGRGFTKEVSENDGKKTSIRKVEVNDPNANMLTDKSVLSRIEYECPGTESLVVDALKTEDAKSRIQKFISLTRTCPYSAEIWFILAQEYQAVGRYSDASRCLQAALSVDPDHKEALEMQDSLTRNPKKNQ